jgi:hypothetical protein
MPPSPEWLMSSNMMPYWYPDVTLPPELATERLRAAAALPSKARANARRVMGAMMTLETQAVD